jgi:hypothetical protein
VPGTGDLELLQRYRPLLLWDSQEDCRAVSAETIVVNPGNLLKRGKRVLAGACGEGARQLTLELLCDAPSDIRPRKKDRLVEAAPPVADARRLQADARYANQVHGDVIRSSKRIFLRYWIWLYYTTQTPLGVGRHEGSWQLVEVTLDKGSLQPIAVTCSQVRKGERRKRMNEVQWRSCATACSHACRHPVVYLAAFSHNCYFEAGTHIVNLFFETPDGAVDEGLPDVVRLGAWKDWPGSWGGSRGRIYHFGDVGKSPRSPAHRKDLWMPKRRFVRKKTRRGRPLHHMWRWKLGAHFSPWAPKIGSVVREADSVVVEWRVQRSMFRRARWLLITLHQGENSHRLVCGRSVRVRSDTGQTRLVLGAHAQGPVVVKASALNWVRQRSDVVAAQETDFRRPREIDVPSPRDEWSPRVWKAFHRQLVIELMRGGAATIEELEQRQFHVLELALDPTELTAVIESARRLGLVKALPAAHRADGTTPPDNEWAVTEDGSKWAPGALARALKGVALVPPVVAIAALSQVVPLVSKQDRSVILGAAAAGLLLVVVAALMLRRYVGGAAAHSAAIANEWSRHAAELPFLNRRYVRRRASIVSRAVMTVGYATSFAAPVLGPPGILYGAGLAMGVVGQLVFQFNAAGRTPTDARAIRQAQSAREERTRTTGASTCSGNAPPE